MILTKSLQNWMGISRTGATAPERILKNTGTTSGKTRTPKAREEPLLFQTTVRLSVSVIPTRRSFTAEGRRPVTTRRATTMRGGSPHRGTEEKTQKDAEEGLENSSRVLKTGRGCSSRLRGWRGKGCRRRRGLTLTTSRGQAGGEWSRAEDEAGSETSVPGRGQMTREGGQVRREDGGTHRVLTETDEERTHTRRGPPPLKDKEEKRMTPLTLGKFRAKCFDALSQGNEAFRGSHPSNFP